MSLRAEFESTGGWLFRHRSFLPLLALPLLIEAVFSFRHISPSHQLDATWDALALLISLGGLAIRVLTVGYTPQRTSGRNTHRQVADSLNTTGMYSLVRHPLYLGNYLAVLGVTVFFHRWELVLSVTCLYALYYERIMFAEEAFLRQRFGENFERWAAITPAIVPKLRGWRQPTLGFSWRKVLRREYTGLLLVTSAFFLLETIGDSMAAGRLHIEWAWGVLFSVGLVGYVVLRTLKKNTEMLKIPGR